MSSASKRQPPRLPPRDSELLPAPSVQANAQTAAMAPPAGVPSLTQFDNAVWPLPWEVPVPFLGVAAGVSRVGRDVHAVGSTACDSFIMPTSGRTLRSSIKSQSGMLPQLKASMLGVFKGKEPLLSLSCVGRDATRRVVAGGAAGSLHYFVVGATQASFEKETTHLTSATVLPPANSRSGAITSLLHCSTFDVVYCAGDSESIARAPLLNLGIGATDGWSTYPVDSFVEDLSLSGNTFLLAAKSDGRISAYDVRIASPRIMELNGHEGAVTGVAVCPDATKAVSVGNDARLCFWDLRKSECFATYDFDEPLTRVVVTQDDGQLVVGTKSGSVIVIDPLVPSDMFALAGHSSRISSLCVSNPSTWMVSAAENVVCWEMPAGPAMFKCEHPAPVRCVGIFDDQTGFAAVNERGEIGAYAVSQVQNDSSAASTLC